MLHWLRRKPQLEEKASTLTEPDAELLALFTGVQPGSLAVSTAVALSVPAVSCAVRTIAEAAASLDNFVERKDGTKWVAEEDHPAAKLLHGSCNDWTSGYELIRDLVSMALTYDAGGLAWIGRAEDRVVEIIVYKPGALSVEYPNDTGEPVFRRGGSMVPAANILHLRGPFSRCPLSMAREAIGVAKLMEQHCGSLFRNGARPAGVIELAGSIGEQALARLKAGWKAAHEGSDNGGRTAVLYGGAKFNPLTFASTDAQFLELRKFQVEEICRAFRVPPGLLFEMTRQTWSNMEQATREFLVFSLEPWLRALEACLTRSLIDSDDRSNFRIRFDRDDLTRASLTERATAINSLRASEVLSADEGRSWLDLAPRADGKGDTYENPNIAVKPDPAKAAA